MFHYDCKIKVFLMLENGKSFISKMSFFSVLTRQVVQASKMMTTLALQLNRCPNEVRFSSSTIVTRLKRRMMIRCRYQRSPLVSCLKKNTWSQSKLVITLRKLPVDTSTSKHLGDLKIISQSVSNSLKIISVIIIIIDYSYYYL